MNSLSITQLSEALQALTDEQRLKVSPLLQSLAQETGQMLHEEPTGEKLSLTGGEPFEIGMRFSADLRPTQRESLKTFAKDRKSMMPAWLLSDLPADWLEKWSRIEGGFMKWLSSKKEHLNHFAINAAGALEAYAEEAGGKAADAVKELLAAVAKAKAASPQTYTQAPGLRIDEVKLTVNQGPQKPKLSFQK